MEHVVFFPAHDGSPAFRRVASLEDAVRLVEHLRNVEGVNEVSCHALTEVPLAFRAYYRVEVPAGVGAMVSEQSTADVQAVDGAAVEVAQVEVAAVEPDAATDAVANTQVEVEPLELAAEPVLAAANGRSSDGAKSLGFFA